MKGRGEGEMRKVQRFVFSESGWIVALLTKLGYVETAALAGKIIHSFLGMLHLKYL